MILVTGGTGNVGSALVSQLVDAGEKVRVMTRDPGGRSFPDGVEVVPGDLTRPARSARRSTPRVLRTQAPLLGHPLRDVPHSAYRRGPTPGLSSSADASASSAHATWNGLPSPPPSTTTLPWCSLNSRRPALRSTVRMVSASRSRLGCLGRFRSERPLPYACPDLLVDTPVK
ncbi:SDR family oxidoreductase [Nonomuraea phyllanthi]|uniref:SDR family oxidoreductase n=1 Tax=Nonomuraea phyllanthi TaxID=2219224 RepID=UPI001D02C0E1|nr:NAD(P)H-binding protein [Nonomuraea phyllanthi]